jgi:hypothetical protein
MERLNRELPPDSLVLHLWEPRSYYLERRNIPDVLLDNWTRPLFVSADAFEVAVRWREDGITHVLLYRDGLDFLLRQRTGEATPWDVEQLMQLERRDLRLEFGVPLQLHRENGLQVLGPARGPSYNLYALVPPAER